MTDWHDWFYYDETSPTFLRWKVQRGPATPGRQVGYVRQDGYACFGFCRHNYLAHRAIYEMFKGVIPYGFQVDHIDKNPSNNRPSNLRAVEPAVNQRNMKRFKNNSSGITGVSRFVVKGRNDKTFAYWVSSWKDEHGKQRGEHFSVLQLGEDGARELAIAHRNSVIEGLNKIGMGYTQGHGTTDAKC